MFLKIIMGIGNIILILAFYFVTTPAVDKRRNRYFGMKIMGEPDEKLKGIVHGYKKTNKMLLLVFLFIIVVSFFYNKSMYVLLTHVIVFIFGMLSFYGVMIKYTMAFDEALLDDKDIISKVGVKKTRKVDLFLAKEGEHYQFTSQIYNLTLPLILNIIMLIKIFTVRNVNHMEHKYISLYLIMFSMNILLIILSVLFTRYVKNKEQIAYTENREENICLNFTNKNAMIHMIYLISNINIIANFLFVITIIKSLMIASMFLILAAALTVLLIAFLYKKFNHRNYSDENGVDNWIYGIFYYNKMNPKLMVNQRFGLGTTVNIAKPAGKVIALLSVLIVLITYSYMVYIVVGNEVIDHRLITTDDMVHITSLNYSVSVDRRDIKDVLLVDISEITLGFKSDGVGTEDYSRGYYEVNNFGKCFVCINKSVDKIILLKTEDEMILFNEKNMDKTKDLYIMLKKFK